MLYAKHRLKTLLALTLGITLPVACTMVAASPLRLLVTGNDSPAMPLYIAVYPDSAEDWDGEPILLLREVLPETDIVDIALNIPPGDYAIRAFVDLDGNGQLDLSRRGRPTEPYASSLNRDRTRRSQRFEHAIIRLSADQPSVTLGLTYPRETAD